MAAPKISPRLILPALAWTILGIAVFKYLIHPIHDGDTWWHLASGRFILENRTFLRTEVFSHTIAGAPWINFEWLSQILMYTLVKHAGLIGLHATKAVLGLAVLVLLGTVLYRSGARGSFLFILFWTGYHMAQTRICTRVELASLLLFPLFILAGLSYRNIDARSRFVPWILFFLMAVWVNLHGGFLYGIGIFALFSLGARWAKWPRNSIAFLDLSCLLMVGASIMNPFGAHIYQVFIQHASDFSRAPGLIAEWEPVTIKSSPLFWIVCVAGLVIIARAVREQKRHLYFWIPALLAFGFVASKYSRNTALFAFVALPFIAHAAQTWGGFSLGKKPAAHIIEWALCLALLLPELPALAGPRPPVVDWNTVPKGACEFVAKENINGVMFNTYGFGGYINWALKSPERKIFMDGRYIFYPTLVEEQALTSGQFPFTEAPWRDYFNRYKIDYAITKYEPLRLHRDEWQLPFRHESVLNIMFPRAEWALVYWDDAALVFVRRTERYQGLIEKNEFRRLWPYDVERMANLLSTGELKPQEAARELERHGALQGLTQRGRQMAAVLQSPGAVALQNNLHPVANKRNNHGAPVEHRGAPAAPNR